MTRTLGMGAATEGRELGSWGDGDGPTLLAIGGIHGNETAGPEAIRRVLGRLQEQGLGLQGQLVGLVGNLQALSKGVRFVDRDLNRQWMSTSVEALAHRDRAGDEDEDREQRELIDCFEEITEAKGPLVVVDLHSSSAQGPPFICLADTVDNRRIAMVSGLPLILGIEEAIDGSLLEYWSQRGVVNFAVEGGRHADPETVDSHEAVLWLLLDHLGMLPPGGLDLTAHRAHIAAVTQGEPEVVEIFEQRRITPEDRFQMMPGFRNFQSVEKGEHLATDRNGPILADRACRVMLPLYQEQGEDGYFLARDVRPFWMAVASLLRGLRLDAIAHWFPGVRRSASDNNTILVNSRV
ncbi:MAG: succinylglutamate desuccinylase/aspartoacylase family protein, partial [Planctomycetota bacterium]|nr:succinylglutamate desuccinylase/aspartoacylase family protein [Planctomycetota bacterium]